MNGLVNKTGSIKSALALLLAIFMLLTPLASVYVSADPLSNDEVKAINEWPNWVADQCGGGSSPSPSLGNGTITPGPVYIMGDSITALAKNTYNSKFSSNGWAPTINGLSSRQIQGGVSPDGLTALDNDKTTISQAHAIVIALGTNGVTNSAASTKALVEKAMTKIKGYDTQNAPIFWVNVLDTNHDAASKTTNQAIKDGVGSDGTIIDWYGEAKSKADLASFNGGVHPTKQSDIDLLGNLVYTAVAGQQSTPTNGSPSTVTPNVDVTANGNRINPAGAIVNDALKTQAVTNVPAGVLLAQGAYESGDAGWWDKTKVDDATAQKFSYFNGGGGQNLNQQFASYDTNPNGHGPMQLDNWPGGYGASTGNYTPARFTKFAKDAQVQFGASANLDPTKIGNIAMMFDTSILYAAIIDADLLRGGVNPSDATPDQWAQVLDDYGTLRGASQGTKDAWKSLSQDIQKQLGSTINNTSVGSCCPSSGPDAGGSVSGSVSSRVGFGTSSEGQQNLQKAVVEAGQKFDVSPNFIAAFYYAENARTGDSTNNADAASGSPTTGDGKWRDPAPPYGHGAPWDAINGASALGPWQFITSTWDQYKPPGSNDTSDRLDLFKEAMAAGKYLAALGGKNGASQQALKTAAHSYNISDTYAQSVLNTYNYLLGNGSVTVGGSGPTTDCSSSTTPSSVDGYQDPYRDVKQKTPMRIDMGLDYGGTGPVHPLGNATIDVVYGRGGGSGWPGWSVKGEGGWVSYTLSDGPAKGKVVYFAENCVPRPNITHGKTVTPDDVICDLDGLVSDWSESGWAAGDTGSGAAAGSVWAGHDDSAHYTAYGENFSQLISKLGEKPGTIQPGAQKLGTLPSGWPTW
jgi:hypothetical protein